MPPMASTIRMAKSHVISAPHSGRSAGGVGQRFSRAATISATASSTSSVSTIMSRSAALILPSASAVSRSQSSMP